MKIAYFDCFSGASGDMIIGALIDAGLPFASLQQAINKIPFKPRLKLRCARVERCGIVGTGFTLASPDRRLSYPEMIGLIRKSKLSDTVKIRSIRILDRIKSAESHVHHTGSHTHSRQGGTHCRRERPNGVIKFAELGAIDTVVDIAGAVAGLELLGISEIYISPLPLNRGAIKSHHGIYPVPGPATLELLKDFDVFPSPINAELLTPTGAAILTTLGKPRTALPVMKINVTGYGAGAHEIPNQPNMLRVIIGEADDTNNTDTVMVLETNLDDTTPQVVGYLIDKLLDNGALDAVAIPVQMKKSRPGLMLQVITEPNQAAEIEKIIFTETPTFGIRKYPVWRSKLNREVVAVKTPYGKIRVKLGRLDKKVITASPEYDDCRAAAIKHKVSLREVTQAVNRLTTTI